ncbi:MAG: hypothetical protein IPO48_19185 [Saprospiraceae bacterium]|nr:hypothetical protein [Saprospiraceae bacterium]
MNRSDLIIHENRFTYEMKDCTKSWALMNIGEQKTLHPIPLGGIAIKRR